MRTPAPLSLPNRRTALQQAEQNHQVRSLHLKVSARKLSMTLLVTFWSSSFQCTPPHTTVPLYWTSARNRCFSALLFRAFYVLEGHLEPFKPTAWAVDLISIFQLSIWLWELCSNHNMTIYNFSTLPDVPRLLALLTECNETWSSHFALCSSCESSAGLLVHQKCHRLGLQPLQRLYLLGPTQKVLSIWYYHLIDKFQYNSSRQSFLSPNYKLIFFKN